MRFKKRSSSFCKEHAIELKELISHVITVIPQTYIVGLIPNILRDGQGESVSVPSALPEII